MVQKAFITKNSKPHKTLPVLRGTCSGPKGTQATAGNWSPIFFNCKGNTPC